MDNYVVNLEFIRALSKCPSERTDEEVKVICSCFRQLDVFSKLGDVPLRALCRHARYEQHRANDTLFRRGQLASCWYILLSGAVFMDRHMYFPRDCFGKRSGQNNRRNHDCFILEPSEMIVVDYPDVHHIATTKAAGSTHSVRKEIQSMNLENAAQAPPSYDYARAMMHRSTGGDVASTSSSTTRGGTLKQNRIPCSTTVDCYGPEGPAPTYYYDGNRLEQLPNVDTGTTYHDGTFPGRRTGMPSPASSSGTATRRESPNATLKKLNRIRSSATTSTSSTSYVNSAADARKRDTTVSTSEADDDHLTGLPETNVDSDDDDVDDDDDESCPSADSFLDLKDHVRTCLEKEPNIRTDDDVHVLLDFMQHMPAFASLPVSVKRELCMSMVFAVVERAGQTVMGDKEQLDSWSVIVNGEVEVVMSDGQRIEYHLGDSFGVEPRPEAQFHRGAMRTLVDDCQFVLVAQEDYVRIIGKAAEHLKRHKDAAGEIVSETERRTLDSHEGYVLIKGKAEKLISHLIEDRDKSVDLYYVDDFFLMYRTFLPNPVTIFEKLIHWFGESHLREKVARLVIIWANAHFNDFETNSEMIELLERFEQALEREDMTHHQQLLNIACSVKSRSRTVIYTRSNRDEVLHFHVLGGYEKGYGIFVSKVEPNTQADRVGLKRGDEILEVNNDNFQHRTHQKALELLRGSTHLSITVKSNLLGFREMLQATDQRSVSTSVPPKQGKSPSKKTDPLAAIRAGQSHSAVTMQSQSCAQLPSRSPGLLTPRDRERIPTGSSDAHKATGVNFIDKLKARLKNGNSTDDGLADSSSIQSRTRIKPSLSNPDISKHVHHGSKGTLTEISQYYQPVPSNSPEHVLKIYKSDQSFKYLTVYKETTAQNVVQLALQEFGMLASCSSLEWSLCEVTVTDMGEVRTDGHRHVIKQRRLPDPLQNLAERIQLNSRYYLKNNLRSENLVPDELAPELLKESSIQLAQLNAQTLAAQLTLQDFAVFAAIESTEYVDNLFKLDSRYGWPKLSQFEQLVNREMWWVATEICREPASHKRARLIRKFIKIARHCREFRNFNSMFAIASGLEKPAVRRLQTTWDKVPTKYHKMFDDIRLMLDPSRNMSQYRQQLQQVSQEPPVIPLFPVVKKDLTFIHEGNSTYCDGLINFEKLRMIGKEIRALGKLSSAPYELGAMSEQSGAGRLNDALLHMNSFEGGNTVATMRKANQVKAPQPRKKLYEQALMVRKVKSYLENLKVVDDEHELDRMSQELEPSATAGSVSVARKRLPSPSPSSTSSLSNHSDPRRLLAGPKFGADSPQAMQKMRSLVNYSKVRPPPQRSISTTQPPPAPSISDHLLLRGGDSPVIVRRAAAAAHLLQAPSNRLLKSGLGAAGRSHSEVLNGGVRPVDLTAESSSVTPTALLTPGLRISSTGSVASTDSAVSQHSMLSIPTVPGVSHAISCDSTDSGHVSMAATDVRHNPNLSPTLTRRSHPPANLDQKQATNRTTKVMVSGAAMSHRPSPFFPSAAAGDRKSGSPSRNAKYANVKVPVVSRLVRPTTATASGDHASNEQISRV